MATVLAGIATNAIFEMAKKHISIPVAVGLIAGAAFLMWLLEVTGTPTSPAGGQAATPPANTETPQPSTPSPSTPTPSPPPSSPPPTTTPPVPPTSLLKLTWARESTDSTSDIEFRGPISIDGTPHDEALVFDCNIWCNGTSPQVYEVTLGRNFKTFTATAAVLDEYNGPHRFQIRLDQREPLSYTTSPANAVPIKLDVTGVTRIRVEFYRTAEQEAVIASHKGIYMGMALASPMVFP